MLASHVDRYENRERMTDPVDEYKNSKWDRRGRRREKS